MEMGEACCSCRTLCFSGFISRSALAPGWRNVGQLGANALRLIGLPSELRQSEYHLANALRLINNQVLTVQ